MRTSFSGFSLAKRSPMERSTGMSFLAHSMRLSPAAASRMSFMSYPLSRFILAAPFVALMRRAPRPSATPWPGRFFPM